MSRLLGLRHRLRALLFPRAHARDVAEEMRFHMELDAMHQGDAKEAALHFGNRTYYQEEVRRMTWYGAFDAARQDARFAWRSILRNPGFTAMVVLTLALGIGVNAASFAVLDLLFLRNPGGVEQPETLRRVHIEHFNSGDGIPFFSQALNHPMYRELVAAVGDSTKTALFTADNALRMGRHPRDPRIRGVYASANYFPLLGARTSLGRTYTNDEDRLGSGVAVAVISDRFRQSHFGGDSSVIGQTVNVEGTSFRVIGVLDPAFGGIDLQSSDVWMPLAMISAPSWVKGPWWNESINMTRFQMLYRLDDGMSDGLIALRATQRLRALQRASRPKRPDTLMNVIPGPLHEWRGPAKLGGDLLIASRLSGVALIVMLIACANVINLLLARAVRRRHEFSIRLALGMSRSRLVRLLATETLLLAVIAAVPALLAASWGGSVLRALLLPQVEFHEAAVGVRVVAFAFGIAVAAGLLAGIVPALQSHRPDLAGALKASPRSGGAHRSRLRRGLVVTQAALTLMLLTGSGLFVRSLRNVQSIDIGFDSNRLVFGTTRFAKGEAPPPAVFDAGMRDVGSRLEARAGIESVARTSFEPMQGLMWLDFFTARDSSGSFEHSTPTISNVSPNFFATVGMRLIRGQTFSGRDDGSSPPHEVVVNDALATRLWPGAEAIGQCMHFRTRESPCHRVVGVVENARQNGVIEEIAAYQFYVPVGLAAQQPVSSTLVLRVAGPTDAATTAMRAALRELFPAGEPTIHTMTENLEPEYRPWRLGATLFTAVGGLALVVALIGIYSTVSYGVAQRTHEFGVRIALGAQLTDLVRQVIGEGVRMVVAGIVVGVLLALAAGQLIATLLYGVDARDPVTMASAALLMLCVAVIAAIVPAWRASRVDPVSALRAE